jgi:ABC-type multidrug transport system fused ATPase/permease subunit
MTLPNHFVQTFVLILGPQDSECKGFLQVSASALRQGSTTGHTPLIRNPIDSLTHAPHRLALPCRSSPAAADGHLGATLNKLLPYLWQYKWRVLLALSCLFSAKVANVTVPLVFKEMIDGLSSTQQALACRPCCSCSTAHCAFPPLCLPSCARSSFARVTQRAVRRIALEVFRHLHELSLALSSRTTDRRGFARHRARQPIDLESDQLHALFDPPDPGRNHPRPGHSAVRYDSAFVLITLASLAAYVVFTIKVSNWRIAIRRKLNEMDSAANTRAIDSLLNYETVKYFNNEEYEARRYDQQMQEWEDAATRSQVSLSWLNLGQQVIIALGVTAMMWRAASGVVDGSMTIGDLVLVNAFLIQLYMPLNFLGVVYREIRQALADIERMFDLLAVNREIADAPDAACLPPEPGADPFSEVDFFYEPNRQILQRVDFRFLPDGRSPSSASPAPENRPWRACSTASTTSAPATS